MHCLICRVGERACALALEHVREVMRPLAVERVLPAPPYLLGLSIIRGQSVPVIDGAALLAGTPGPATRWVLLRVGVRCVALAVTAVVGARTLDPAELAGLPPLLAESRHLVRALAVLDGALLEVLESGRLIELAPALPEEVASP